MPTSLRAWCVPAGATARPCDVSWGLTHANIRACHMCVTYGHVRNKRSGRAVAGPAHACMHANMHAHAIGGARPSNIPSLAGQGAQPATRRTLCRGADAEAVEVASHHVPCCARRDDVHRPEHAQRVVEPEDGVVRLEPAGVWACAGRARAAGLGWCAVRLDGGGGGGFDAQCAGCACTRKCAGTGEGLATTAVRHRLVA